MKKNIYSYTDYKEYLRDFYIAGKEDSIALSFRTMSQSMGFTSPNYLKLIMDGQRHIGKSSIDKVCKGLRLKSLESEYFSYLLFFAKAKTTVDKNFYYGQIARMRNGKDLVLIEESQLSYYEHWYTPIIRELICGEKKNNIDYSAIAREISPPIHHKQAQASVKTLEQLGFLVVDEEGIYRHKTAILNSHNEVSSCAVKEFHKKMISLGSESIDSVERENREISSVTMKISKTGFLKIKQRVQDFREEILQMVQDDTDVDHIAQLNFQLFPLSKSEDSNE